MLAKIIKFIGKVSRFFGRKDSYREGSWYGNDTIWRTIHDLNNIVYNCDQKGSLKDCQQRVVFTINDGVVSGDMEGPMEPRERNIGLLSASFSTYYHDLFITPIMGFDWEKIPFLENIFNPKDIKLKKCIINGKYKNIKEMFEDYDQNFIPTQGWKGHIKI